MKCFAQLDHKALFKVEGPDAEKFLQGQLSCDVVKLLVGQHCLGTFCSAQGRMHGNFYLYRNTEQQFIFQLERSILDSFTAQLGKYIVFSKANITVLDDFRVFAMEKNQTPLPDDLIGDSWLISHAAYEEFWTSQNNLPVEGLAPCPVAYFQLLDIQQGLAWVTDKTAGEYIPQMFNMDLLGAISFEKGCYTGQEIVARAHYRGQVKRRIYRGQIENNEAVISLNADLTDADGKTLGNVVSIATGTNCQEILFVINKPEYLEADLLLEKEHPVRQLPLPYVITEQSSPP